MIRNIVVFTLLLMLSVFAFAEEEQNDFNVWIKKSSVGAPSVSSATPVIRHPVDDSTAIILFSVEKQKDSSLKNIKLLQVDIGQSLPGDLDLFENIVNPAVSAALQGSHFEGQGIHLLVLTKNSDSQADNSYSAKIQNESESASGVINLL